MYWFAKKNRKAQGSLLIEAAVAVTILSVGLVTVMQSYGAYRQSVTANEEYTELLLKAQGALGGVYAGIPVSKWASGQNAGVELKDGKAPMAGLREVSLTVTGQRGQKPRTIELGAYVKQ